MKLKRIRYSILLLVIFFCQIEIVFGAVIINEVKLSPTEERFIELYNNGDTTVNLTDWYIQRKTINSTFGSLVTKPNFENKTISPGGYFLISKSGIYSSDITIENLTLTESNTIQLKNKEGNVVDKVGWGDLIDCTENCAPNPISGKSISRIRESWVVSTPTPRTANTESDSSNDSLDITYSNNEETIKNEPKKEEVYKISTKIISPKVVTAGVPFTLDHQTFGIKKEKVILGKFIWNFGDGMTKEGKTSDAFPYLYKYPGDYALTLSYYNSVFSINPEATDRIIIKVVPSGINIISVGTRDDPYIEIENKSSYEISLNKMIIIGSLNSFAIPEGMIILPNKKLKLSPIVTGFDFNDLTYIKIVDQTGQVFATYPSKTSSIVKYSSNKNSEIYINNPIVSGVDQEVSNREIINLNDLTASALNTKNDPNIRKLTYIGLIIVIIVGATSIILIRGKNDYPDYIDKEVTANDIKIIE